MSGAAWMEAKGWWCHSESSPGRAGGLRADDFSLGRLPGRDGEPLAVTNPSISTDAEWAGP